MTEADTCRKFVVPLLLVEIMANVQKLLSK
jgi:hypothetical protein